MPRHILFAAVLFSAAFFISCKDDPVAPGGGNNNGTTPASIGDSVPAVNSRYTYDKSQLTTADLIIPGFPLPNFTADVFTNGTSFNGKTNAYLVVDEHDSAYYTYESNGDVSIYYVNPGYSRIYGHPGIETNEPLEQAAGKVFAQWITLPIASKKTNQVIYDSNEVPIEIGAGPKVADIKSVVDYVGDTSISVGGKLLSVKICKITLTAQLKTKANGSNTTLLSHTRTLWFVPKIGYFAKILTRTNMPEWNIDSIPQDTTATLKVLTSYKLN
jgi:hypothetical protein